MKRRNPAFIILIFLFWYYSTIRERKKPLLQDIFHKVRVTNLTQGGLRAMNDLEELERERGNSEYVDVGASTGSLGSLTNYGARTASNEMCTFLVMNISSLQLIPVNIIAYRSQYGSANPAAVIAPAIVATFFSTVVAVVYCKIMNRKQGV
jgi:spore maturation protein A